MYSTGVTPNRQSFSLLLPTVRTSPDALQRGGDGAAVYGTVTSSGADVTEMIELVITVTAVRTAYTVAPANIRVQPVNASYARWKARLQPGSPADGPLTIEVRPNGNNSAAASIRNVVHGEVWFCRCASGPRWT